MNIKKICQNCSIEFRSEKRLDRIFCSRACSNAVRKNGVDLNCIMCKKVFYVKIRRKNTAKCCSLPCLYAWRRKNGKTQPWGFKKGHKHTREIIEKARMSKFLKYGRTGPIREDRRNDPAYKWWRLQVLRNDGYRCRICGEHGIMNADHIYSWAKYPRLRYELNNGQALCRECHIVKTRFEQQKSSNVIFAV